MIVGNVLIVDVNINAKEETRANIYNHHHCFSNNNPGTIMHSFVEKAQNSIELTLFQYSLEKRFFVTIAISFIFNFTTEVIYGIFMVHEEA